MKFAAITVLSLLALPAFAQEATHADMKSCPMHEQHQSHQDVVVSHGDQAMGFSHEKTTHHFLLAAGGGVIEVTVNDTTDKDNLKAVQSHLSHISMMFASGDFSIPMFIHDGVPAGMTTMKLMKAAIHYSYEATPSGGRVRLQSSDAIGIAAIQDFIRFQITEHQTGDSLEAAQK